MNHLRSIDLQGFSKITSLTGLGHRAYEQLEAISGLKDSKIVKIDDCPLVNS